MLERLLANWPLKALALVLAFAIWLSITGQDRTVRDFTVPLEIVFGSDRTAETPPPTAQARDPGRRRPPPPSTGPLLQRLLTQESTA